jgi:ubiquinone/menaquinone biosynthesis C-methylase UbiE
VLDVGCGGGYFLHGLREYGAGDCHGIDLMENRIASASERYPGVRFHMGSATELPFEEGEFDLVAQFTCLSSILDPHVRLVAAREMKRAARGVGYFRSTCSASSARTFKRRVPVRVWPAVANRWRASRSVVAA